MTQAMSDGSAQTMFAADWASQGLGITLLEAADGAAKLRMTVTEAMEHIRTSHRNTDRLHGCAGELGDEPRAHARSAAAS
jgi:hypothetical protein